MLEPHLLRFSPAHTPLLGHTRGTDTRWRATSPRRRLCTTSSCLDLGACAVLAVTLPPPCHTHKRGVQPSSSHESCIIDRLGCKACVVRHPRYTENRADLVNKESARLGRFRLRSVLCTVPAAQWWAASSSLFRPPVAPGRMDQPKLRPSLPRSLSFGSNMFAAHFWVFQVVCCCF